VRARQPLPWRLTALTTVPKRGFSANFAIPRGLSSSNIGNYAAPEGGRHLEARQGGDRPRRVQMLSVVMASPNCVWSAKARPFMIGLEAY
jgi:hypothetical protein